MYWSVNRCGNIVRKKNKWQRHIPDFRCGLRTTSVLLYVVLYNRMMVYVENHAYQAELDKETETKNT